MALIMLLMAIPLSVFPVLAAKEGETVLSSTVFAPNEDTWPTFDAYDASL